MPGTCTSENGLLLLLKAAKKIDEEDCRKKSVINEIWEQRSSRQVRNDKFSASGNQYNQRKLMGNSKRAHLRTCMEELKDNLDFESDAPRITMLNVLKKATQTITKLKNDNKLLLEMEEKQKQKSSQLTKRRNSYKKKIEQRLHNRKIQNWRERNRNYSECSVATTSSEDSELDCHARAPRMILPSQVYLNHSNISQRSITPTRKHITSSSSTNSSGDIVNIVRSQPDEVSPNTYRVKQRTLLSAPSSAGTSPPPSSAFSTSSNMCTMDTFDGSSLDSGYEETVGHNVNGSATDLVNHDVTSKSVSHLRYVGKISNLTNAAKVHVQQAGSDNAWNIQGNVQLAADSIAYL